MRELKDIAESEPEPGIIIAVRPRDGRPTATLRLDPALPADLLAAQTHGFVRALAPAPLADVGCLSLRRLCLVGLDCGELVRAAEVLIPVVACAAAVDAASVARVEIAGLVGGHWISLPDFAGDAAALAALMAMIREGEADELAN